MFLKVQRQPAIVHAANPDESLETSRWLWDVKPGSFRQTSTTGAIFCVAGSTSSPAMLAARPAFVARNLEQGYCMQPRMAV